VAPRRLDGVVHILEVELGDDVGGGVGRRGMLVKDEGEPARLGTMRRQPPAQEPVSMPVLTCRKVLFYSEGDELSFFAWVGKIKAIRRWEGRGDCILLHVPRRVSGKELRELLALFYRYRIDMGQLAQFQTPANDGWFADPKKDWHKLVFRRRGVSDV
jgi:hypothetical protein